MDEHNPYAPPSKGVTPSAALAGQGEGDLLAGRGVRLLATIVDTLLLMAVLLPLQWVAGVYEGFPMMEPMGTAEAVGWTLASLALALAIHGRLLATRAQSVGKLLLGIKIVDLSGRQADFRTIVLRRIVPVTLGAAIPFVGGILAMVDALMIFGRERRCLHDQIAGTRVVRA